MGTAENMEGDFQQHPNISYKDVQNVSVSKKEALRSNWVCSKPTFDLTQYHPETHLIPIILAVIRGNYSHKGACPPPLYRVFQDIDKTVSQNHVKI